MVDPLPTLSALIVEKVVPSAPSVVKEKVEISPIISPTHPTIKQSAVDPLVAQLFTFATIPLTIMVYFF